VPENSAEQVAKVKELVGELSEVLPPAVVLNAMVFKIFIL